MSKHVAPAKVNLHLAITDVKDDGYHELDTSFVFVDVGDTLDISLADELTVLCSDASLSGQENLVYQVLSAFAIKHNIDQGLHIEINKKLPSQAGLGGGSSDSATALVVANKLWQVDCNQDQLIAFSAPFGADIPCFIYGEASLAKGIGEQLSPFPHHIPTETIVLAWPGMGVSTAAAFAHFDENYFHALTDESSAAKVRARSDGESFVLGYNDLEQSAITLCSPLEDMLSAMRKQSVRAWMSGSGSACVALCHSSAEAQRLVDDLTSKALASWVHIGHFMPEHPLREKIGA